MSKSQIKNKQSEQIINQKIDQRVKSTNKKTTITLESGKNATTMQGGLEVPIMFKEVLAGEYIKEWNIQNITRLLTPLVPTMDRLYLTIKAFFVPHTRVWEDAEKILAGKGDYDMLDDTLVTLLPHTSVNENMTKNFYFKNTLAHRYGIPYNSSATYINLLLPRGYRAIENDFLRIKEYEPKKTEWNSNNAVVQEQNALNIVTTADEIPSESYDKYMLAPAKARDGYLTNLKKNMSTNDNSDYNYAENPEDIWSHLDWENRYKDEKQRIDNAEKNDWDIIAEMGGTSPVYADRVQLLGVLDYELNYQQITQSSPEINDSSPLGTTGSFSYTNANGRLFSHKEFKQPGFIHILANINIDQKLENGIPKELLKRNVNDLYRPGLAKKELQHLDRKEINSASSAGFVAYQPAWAEYKRLPSFATGEMQSERLNKENGTTTGGVTNSQWHNMIHTTNGYIDQNYLRPVEYVNKILARNNILNLDWAEGIVDHVHIYFKDDPVMNMSEHIVKTALPILSSDLHQTEKAEKET